MRRIFHVGFAISALVACNRTFSGPSSPSQVQVQGLVASTGETLFTEDFESDSLGEWQDGYDPARHRIVTDHSSAQSGSRYLSVTYPQGRDGGWLTRFFMPGYETMYVSLYVRFPMNWKGGTKLVGLYGSRTDDQWSGFGKAGICPKGTDFFDAMLITEPTGDPGPLRFYTYYPLMFRDNDGVSCWGRYNDITNRAASYTRNTVGLGKWHHIEFQVQLNDPGQSNGRQVFWVDDAQGAIWPGLSFRDTDILKLNAVQLSFSYGANGVSQPLSLDMDNIVVRTSR